jgi:hypothetical protein
VALDRPRNPRDRAKAKVSQAFAAMTWIPLSENQPAANELVMVMMKDGSIETARWDSKKFGFSRPPFCNWGDPVSWSALPKTEESS